MARLVPTNAEIARFVGNYGVAVLIALTALWYLNGEWNDFMSPPPPPECTLENLEVGDQVLLYDGIPGTVTHSIYYTGLKKGVVEATAN